MDDDPNVQANSASKGYRKPPAAARFQKGKSGNPAGRPKGARTRRPPAQGERLRSLMLEEAYRPINVVSEDGDEITLPMAQAVFRSLAEAAAKGEARAQAMFLKIVSETEGEAAVIEQMLDDEMQHSTTDELAEPVHRVEFRIIDPADPKGTDR